MSKSGYVYLLGDWEKEGVYKIGVTTGKIENRIKKLQTGNGGEIYLVNYYYSDYPFYVEKWMHLKYYGVRKKGEWFELDLDKILTFKKDCEQIEKNYKEFLKNKEEFDF